MSEVRPFRAYRPNTDEVEKIASPPYDVLSRDEAKRMVEDNPLSFLHVVKAEVDLPEDVDLYDEKVYKKSRENLDKLIEEGHLVQESKPSFYLYTQEMGEHTQNGLVCLASVDEYDEGKIKIHESTRRAKEEDRTKHIDTLNAQSGPVFLALRDNKNTTEIHDIFDDIKERVPLFEFKSNDGVVHTVWKISDEETIGKIEDTIGRAKNLYIADGHHRSKAASLVREKRRKNNPDHTGEEDYNYFLTVIFPHSELKILPYNRAVRDMGGLTEKEYFDGVKKNFEIESIEGRYKPEIPHHFGMFYDGKWYHLKAKDGSFPEEHPVLSIDASILQENLLEPVLDIKNPKESDRIKFVGGIRGMGELERLVNSGEFILAFALYPTSVEQLLSVADAEMHMPPKSTWFEPKLKSGLFVHKL